MNDPGTGKKQRHKTQYLEIVRHLVDDAGSAGRMKFEQSQKIIGEIYDPLAAECGEVFFELLGSFLVSVPLGKPDQADKLARPAGLRVAGNDLFGERRSRPRHADDEDRKFA